MELKDLISVASLTVAIISVTYTIYHNRRNRKLEEEKMLYQREQDAQAELNKAIEKFDEKIETKSHAQVYCEHVIQKFKYLDFTGLNAILQKKLLLENIYVKLRAKQSYKLAQYHTIEEFNQLKKERNKQHEEEEKKVKPEDFVDVFKRLRQEHIKKGEPLKLVILGHPGSGKTTLMKWIAMQCVCSKDKVFSEFIPVFIPLKDLGRDPDKTYRGKNILELVDLVLKCEAISTSFLSKLFEANRLLFLFDGLDEVADETIRREVIDWIQRQNIRKNTLLVTSRFSGLQESKGLKFHDAVSVFEIQDFDISDIEKFLENWYRNIEVAISENGDQENAIKQGERQYQDLMHTIKSNSYENLRRLAVNPLLLTIIAIVHRTRAVLPKERHKLYDECLRVMVELWHVANKKLNVSFSVENSLINLSKIAVFLMKHDRREIELSEMIQLLPSEIENHPRNTFLKEMILKAGLLYESEGKYGFLHLTFQEYLAAWYFARSENQNDILKYRDKDYWTETFKLFVNTGNARVFYNEIINGLMEREYWPHMQLWESCLREIVAEDTKKEIEMKFARKILTILPEIEYKEENELLIIKLYAHYPLYEDQFVEDGWNLFYRARHPFLQSVGSSILNRADEKTQADLMEAIKDRIDEFETQKDKRPEKLLDFIYRNNNSFVLLMAGRRNLCDLNFALTKLKSHNFFIIYMNLLDLLDLRDLRELLDLRKFLDRLDLRDLRYQRRYYLDLRYLRSHLDSRGLRYLRDLLDLRCYLDQFIEKYQSVIETHRQEISDWADKAMAKLHALSDSELLKYFPGTGEEDLKAFREGK
ncbi:MAG: NACHT domain-containing protein [Candidatus Omnitrophota bacterium]